MPGLSSEQSQLPGLEQLSGKATRLSFSPDFGIMPFQAETEEEDHRRPGAGQLCLESEQEALCEVLPAPRQLALLPDPPPWEDRCRPALARRRDASNLSKRRVAQPPQASLF